MYRPDQIKVLERQFQDNPYPDFDRFETLSKDLEIPENKLKVSVMLWEHGTLWILNFNPFKLNELAYPYQMDQSISVLRVVRCYFKFSSDFW